MTDMSALHPEAERILHGAGILPVLTVDSVQQRSTPRARCLLAG